MKRRTFLQSSALLTGATLVAPGLWAQAKPLPFMISLTEWSLCRALTSGRLNHLDFPRVAHHDYGLDAIELVSRFFRDKVEDRKYLLDFRQRAGDLGVRILLIEVENEGALGDPDPKKRRQAVSNHWKWLEAGRVFHCHSIRANATTGGVGSYQEQMERAAEGLRLLCEQATKVGLNVLVENEGHLSSNGAWVAALIRKVNMPNCGTLPDFGNFRISPTETYDRYRGVAEMMPYARAISAQSTDFDARGNEIHTDYFRMMRIVQRAGYRGYVGIEYTGERLSETEGIRATQKLLERVRGQMEVPAKPSPPRPAANRHPS